MANGRFVSTDIATDGKLARLTLAAEYLFVKTLPHLDRDGLILADADVLWAEVCPRRPELHGQIDALVAEWELAGLVHTYGSDDGRVVFFPNFPKHQKGLRYNREAPSKLPCPPGYVRTPAGLVKVTDGVSPEQSRSNSGEGPDSLPPAPPVPPASSPVPPAVPAPAPAAGPDRFPEVVRRYESDFGLMSMTIKEELESLYDGFGAEWLLDAMRIAVRKEARNLSYVNAILRRWQTQGRNEKPAANGAAPSPVQQPALPPEPVRLGFTLEQLLQ